MALPDPDEITEFFEGTDFNETTKALGGALMQRINRLLFDHTDECVRLREAKEDCFNSQKLALATCLMMRTEKK